MNKLKYLGLAILSMATLPALAETTSGEVVEIDGSLITIETPSEERMTFQTTDNTNYRKKKLKSHHKKKRGMRSPENWHFTPIAEENDWVEVVYNPKSGTATVYEVDTITVFDD